MASVGGVGASELDCARSVGTFGIAPAGGCEIALGDAVTKFNDTPDWDWWRLAETRASLKDGEAATLKGGDRVLCHADPAEDAGDEDQSAGENQRFHGIRMVQSQALAMHKDSCCRDRWCAWP